MTKLASVRQVENMINKVRKLQQDLIGLADPLLCRTFLPQLQNYLRYFGSTRQQTSTAAEVRHVSAIREMMLHKVPAGFEHFHRAKAKRPNLS